MILNTLERIILAQILPAEGNFQNLKLLRIVREEISFSEEENKLLNFKQIGDKLHWDSDRVINGKTIPSISERDFSIGEVVTGLIVANLKHLNTQAKLTEQHFSLYEKFIES